MDSSDVFTYLLFSLFIYLTNDAMAIIDQTIFFSVWKKIVQSVIFMLWKILPFWEEDFCFGGSRALNNFKIQIPFDYIERQDVQLHADTLIAQFWQRFIILEQFKHSKRCLRNPAKVKSGRPLLFLIWTFYIKEISKSIWLRLKLRCSAPC